VAESAGFQSFHFYEFQQIPHFIPHF